MRFLHLRELMSPVVVRGKITQELNLLLFIFSLTNIASILFIITPLPFMSLPFIFPYDCWLSLGFVICIVCTSNVRVAGEFVLEV
jgi:hypothetical protein